MRLHGKFNYRSIRFRLTSLFVGIFGTTLIVFCSLLYSAFIRNQQNEFDAALFNHVVDISKNLNLDFFGRLSIDPDVLTASGKVFPFSLGRAYVQVIDSNHNVLAHSNALDKGALPLRQQEWTSLSRTGFIFSTIGSNDIPASSGKVSSDYRMLSYLIRTPVSGGLVLQMAVPLTFLDQVSNRLLRFLLLGVPLTLILAAIGGLFISRRALAPMTAITEKAKALGASQLGERIPVPGVNDEIRQLALTLNDLLDRLQQAFESQERFVADASHELKTPLAILKGELDVLRARPRDEREVAEFLGSASQELDYLSRVVEDLLLLARTDVGVDALLVQRVRLDEVALEVVSRLEVLARAKESKIRFHMTGSDFEVRGDADLLKSMLKNLVENAIKFSPQGGLIEVLLSEETDVVRIFVKDQGPGIPQDLQNRIFERFYRVPSGSRVPGAGLGLAITRKILDAHGGTVTVNSSPRDGTEFRVGIKKL